MVKYMIKNREILLIFIFLLQEKIVMRTAKKVWTYLVIALVAMVAAVNYELFVFPNQFAPAGLNGICTIIQHITGISVGYLRTLFSERGSGGQPPVKSEV